MTGQKKMTLASGNLSPGDLQYLARKSLSWDFDASELLWEQCCELLFKWGYEANALICASYRGFTGGGATEELKQEKDDVINIFSVASGHLYERFLR